MNCDLAFDLMTDASRDDSPALHTHLDGCPRCRQMYETLSPALGLFAAAEEPAGQPDFDDAATSVELAQRVAVRLDQSAARSLRATHLRLAWACLIAGGLGFLFAALWSPLQSATPDAVPAAGRCTWVHREQAADQPASAIAVSCVTCHLSSVPPLQQTTFLPEQPPTLFSSPQLQIAEVSQWLNLIVWNTDTIANS